MEIGELFKDALSYPIENIKHFVFIGIIFIIASLPTFAVAYSYDNTIAWAIFVIIEILLGLILGGYEISIISYSTHNSDEAPNIEVTHDFVMGIKSAIVSIVYFIIPLIIVLIVAFLTGTVDAFISMLNTGLDTSTATGAISSTITPAILNGATVVGVVAVILAILFSFFALVAYCRLAEYDSLSEALNIAEVVRDIGRVGWLNFIVWFIILMVINVIIALISSLLGFIPYIGVILAVFFMDTYALFFEARALGLMYSYS